MVKKQEEEVEIDDSVLGTAKIDPEQYSVTKSNPDRIKSLKYAVAGLLYMFRHEQSVKLLSVVTLVILVMVLWLDVGSIQAALVFLSVGLVWMGEFLNSAVEAVVDLAAEGVHPMAKVAKDVASSAVLVGVLIMVSVVVIILGPPLIERLG